MTVPPPSVAPCSTTNPRSLVASSPPASYIVSSASPSRCVKSASLRYPPFSSTITSFPAAASSAATTAPPAPDPTTTTSQLSVVSPAIASGRIGFGTAGGGGGPSGPGYPIARATPGVV